MPLYVYQCDAYREEYEALWVKDIQTDYFQPAECPKCGRFSAHRIIKISTKSSSFESNLTMKP